MRSAIPSVAASKDHIAGEASKDVFVTVVMINDEDCDFMAVTSVANGLLIFLTVE